MALSIFFDAIPSEMLNYAAVKGNIGQTLDIFTETFPNWKKADIAIVHIPETSGSFTNKHQDTAAITFRNTFYRLKQVNNHIRVADLGTLRLGADLDETNSRVREVCETLIAHNTIPLILGGSHDLDLGQYLGYEASGKHITMGIIDSVIDAQEDPEGDEASMHLSRIVQHSPTWLSNIVHIGHQSFLTDYEVLSVMDKLNFDVLRLGQVRDNIQRIEPYIRSCDMISFDLSSLRRSDFHANINSGFYGLSAEEACQISWYAGLGTKLTSFGIYEYNPDLDAHGESAFVVATMIWYFIEGYYHRKEEQDFETNNFLKFTVSLSGQGHDLVFYKSKNLDRWWIKVDISGERKSIFEMIPCDYSDYQLAIGGQIPDVYIRTVSRLM